MSSLPGTLSAMQPTDEQWSVHTRYYRGETQAVIAKDIGKSQQTVSGWIKRVDEFILRKGGSAIRAILYNDIMASAGLKPESYTDKLAALKAFGAAAPGTAVAEQRPAWDAGYDRVVASADD